MPPRRKRPLSAFLENKYSLQQKIESRIQCNSAWRFVHNGLLWIKLPGRYKKIIRYYIGCRNVMLIGMNCNYKTVICYKKAINRVIITSNSTKKILVDRSHNLTLCSGPCITPSSLQQRAAAKRVLLDEMASSRIEQERSF